MDRSGIFAGSDPFAIAQAWLTEAEAQEPNDANAIALATVDADGLPNVRMVLLKEIEAAGEGGGAFVFYTNYGSKKGQEITASGKAAFVLHWKSLRRQIRVRGIVTREEGPQADAYFASRSLKSRLGAWASQQSQPLSSREALLAEAAPRRSPSPKARIRPARPIGAASGFSRWKSNSGPTVPSGCMTASAGPALTQRQTGPSPD